jgi:hypothetical protein
VAPIVRAGRRCRRADDRRHPHAGAFGAAGGGEGLTRSPPARGAVPAAGQFAV